MRRISALTFGLLILLAIRASASENTEEKHEESHAEDHGPKLSDRQAKQSSRDVKLPHALVAQIEREYREFLKDQKDVPAGPIKRKMLNVTVEMRQKRVAALHEDVRVTTPLGGGVIDLADLVTPLRGAFQVLIRAAPEGATEAPTLRVFFVSRSKQRILAGEDYGSGCGRFMGITSLFNEKMAHGGFDVFTADQRYLSVLAGTFVLAGYAKDALHVGSVTFVDSRYPQLMCE